MQNFISHHLQNISAILCLHQVKTKKNCMFLVTWPKFFFRVCKLFLFFFSRICWVGLSETYYFFFLLKDHAFVKKNTSSFLFTKYKLNILCLQKSQRHYIDLHIPNFTQKLFTKHKLNILARGNTNKFFGIHVNLLDVA